MMAFITNKLSLIFLLTLIGGFFRFYNLNWGNPFYFHPDERNIASSVLNINFPNQMNPHFFAYGSFPIYLIYFTTFLVSFFQKTQVLFEQIIIVSRFYSAILSILLIPSIYFVGRKLVNKRVGVLAAIFCALSVGLIQFSHFGTVEMWLTFLGVWFFYFSLILIKQLKFVNIFTVGVIYGLLVATKISSTPLLILPVISIFLNYLPKIKSSKLALHISFLIIFRIIKIIVIAFIVFASISPSVFTDYHSFISSIRYESSVALGTLPVFYTGEFFNSIPILFQFTKIYPFLINPFLTIIFIPAFLYLIFKGIKTKNSQYLILNTCYLILFLSQAFLFAKWTRYILPTLPFMYLILAIFFERFVNKKILNIIIFISVVFTGSYFINVFVKEDTRIQASLWAKENIPIQAKALSEVYDMGVVPFNPYLRRITLFNFYDLDQTQDKSLELKNVLSENEYIILTSQRILKTRLINKNKFPIGHKFYNELINGKLGYEKIYETNCDIFCKITYFGNPVFSFEQTTNVFDRPTVFIFKKNE